ncbi:D-allose transporter subunit [Clostridium liquoris]|uniref:D-allose transporter subunit n=1 Tax=Clostridium liquoris TaxID=1289519 RepID=A0A2T0B5D2_9CLOT|nr:D-allose transporter subunit [Clostridium liquoris]
MLFRIIKRSKITVKKNIMIRISSIVFALLLVAIFIALLGLNPMGVYSSMLKGAFGSAYSIRETIIKAIPLAITALGISVAFKMQFWNIGGEGQIIMGAFLSSYFALRFPELNSFLLLSIMALAGIIGGAIWAYIPAILKCKYGTNETIVTLMMNYIALKFITYLQYGPWKDPNAQGFPKISNFSENAILPDVFGINIGWIITIVLIIFMYIFMNYTKKGYEIAVLGESEKTALYAGINIKSTIVISMLLSGGLCGLAGMIQASAVSNTLSVQVSGGIGYTAIIVAWLSNLSSPLILMVSILFAALLEGGSFIQTAFGIPESVASIIQASILFFVLGSEFFIKYKLVKNNTSTLKEVA